MAPKSASRPTISFLLLSVLAMFICPMSEGMHLAETKMTLYFQDWSAGHNATVVPVTGIPGKQWSFFSFGTVFATDDLITEGLDESSAEIGRAQGIYVTSALDGSSTHVLISIVFTNEEYGGSTLEIQGTSRQFEKVREVSVVAGTGKFRYARGYVTFETVYLDKAIAYSVIRFSNGTKLSTKTNQTDLLLLLAMLIFSQSEELGLRKETKMTLYFQDYSAGSNATVVPVTGIPGKLWSFFGFGTIFVTNDTITEGLDKNSAQIARAQGIYVTSALDGSRTCFDINCVHQ
ncbi:hypothetical protein F0562_011126 [Nyssa sinensis]|uniref:Dirigent protein n=1 Tax=Nyssa sinensis TaxID=561372 RepID=A0A5J5A0Z2_9ASTE|nr:hypothetical protein F0562_011126 [Nyssa sinensis]